MNPDAAGPEDGIRALLRAGRAAEARAAAEALCAREPQRSEHWYLRGCACGLQQHYREAESDFRRALALDRGNAAAAFYLGQTLEALGKTEEALATYRALLAIRPDHLAARQALGTCLHRLGRLAESEASLLDAVRNQPDSPATWMTLGHVRYDRGDWPGAEAAYREVLRREPANADAQLNLGATLSALGRPDEAAAQYRALIALQPDHLDAYLNLARLRAAQGQREEALTCCREARRLGPRSFEDWKTLGTIHAEFGPRREAIECYREALRLDGRDAGLWSDLAGLLTQASEISEGLRCAHEALRRDPDFAPAHHALAQLHLRRGELDEALEHHRAVARLDPENGPLTRSLLSFLNYHPAFGAAEIHEQHRAWGAKHARPRPDRPPLRNAPDPERRLRLGYVSPDLRDHSVAFFLEPILRHHDRGRFEVICYAEVPPPKSDATTTRLNALADSWVNTCALDDAELDRRFRQDRIDVLVDLAGHTTASRLLAMADGPAPVQIAYLGYPATTGVPAIGFRITDAWADPAGQEAFHTEALVRLPSGFLCYQPPADGPEPGPLPAARAGHITFGSFNMVPKTNDQVVARWSGILAAVAGSRLILKAPSFADAATRDRYLARFEDHGIARDRIELLPYLPSRTAHLELYRRVDLALDPFPYNGTTTTCEALWMGVPVVTLAGDRHAARVGTSLLTRLGLTDLIASDERDYAACACRLAADRDRLAALRAGLRQRMRDSTLCDPVGFTRELETAYRDLWRRWCERSRPSAGPAGT